MVDHWGVDSRAIQAAVSASAYASSADATRSVLDLLERQLPDAGVFLAHLDRHQDIHRIVDVRGGAPFRLRADQAVALSDSLCVQMADAGAPRRCNDVAREPLYRHAPFGRSAGIKAYLGVPVELSDGSRIGSLAVMSSKTGRFTADDERLVTMLARVIASELERESNQRDLRRLNGSLRAQARGMAALAQLTGAVAGEGDARPAVCVAACAAAAAPIAFLLEPSGRDFASTAMAGIEMGTVTIQARAQGTSPGRTFMGAESYFVPDARSNPALAAPLVDATGARSALFEPLIRQGSVVGVLIVIWTTPIERLDDVTASILRLVAAQGAVALAQTGLHARVAALAFSDRLTGLASRRTFERELPRELARSRRTDAPLCVAVIDIDHLDTFKVMRGEREGDRLVKEAAALWATALREVDLMARLDDEGFGVLLPSCGLGEACEVVDRLRSLTPREQTASAGVARWDGAEPAELVLLRCRDALAAAKAAGHDMTIADD